MGRIDFNNVKSLFVSGKQSGPVSAEEAKGKEAAVDVPVGKSKEQVENKTVGLDTFVRTSEVNETAGAEALTTYNRVKLNNNNIAGVSTTPAATQARMEAEVLQNTPYLAALAEETGVGAAATVNGVDDAILSRINVTPMLATYLNSADSARIESHMAEFLQYA